MNINWNIHGFPEDEQKDIVKKAMYEYCYEVCNMKIESISIANTVQESYNTYRIMIRFFNNETLSESEIQKCKKFFTSYIKQIESIWHMRNYYHEIEEAKEVCEKCLQWIDEYEQNIETAFN